MTTLEKARARLAAYRKDREKARADKADALKRITVANGLIAKVKKVIQRNTTTVPGNNDGWHPGALKIRYDDAGAFVTAGPKALWHTTEGLSLPTYSGSAPHFTFNPKSGSLWQHMPINRAAKSLEHPAGTVETNRAHAIQVELIAFSDVAEAKRLGRPDYAVVNFTAADYARIAQLARWIEKNAGVPRKCGVKFVPYPSAVYPRLSPSAWLAYAGHLGHQHVPNNHHGDPSILDIKKVLA
jgi:hypothetical protein